MDTQDKLRVKEYIEQVSDGEWYMMYEVTITVACWTY